MSQNSVPVRRLALLVGATVATVALAACSSRTITIQDKKIEYQQAYEVPQLEIPPDLSSGNIQDRMALPEAASRQPATVGRTTAGGSRSVSADSVLPDVEGVRIERQGDKRWLVINGEPSQVWGPVRQYWLQTGFLLAREDEQLGILETEWAENRADIPDDIIRRTLTKIPGVEALYDSSTRDKFRVRLEKGVAAGTTEVYLTHRGIQQVAKGDQFVWQARPADPELEAEMLAQMVLFWGGNEQRVRGQMAQATTRPDRAHLVTGGEESVVALTVDEEFARAWRRTGVALDRIGFAVEERDRAQGFYRVRYQEADTGGRGFFSRLAFWKDDQPDINTYRISLQEGGAQTRIEVRDDQDAPVRNATSKQILTLLFDELR